MKEYRATMTINVFIDADSEEDAQAKFEDMDFLFQNEHRNAYDTDLIDWEIEEVIG
jgi:hypothetical protein